MAKKDKRKNDKAEAPQEEAQKETAPEFIASMAGVLVVGLFIITFMLQAFEIPSSSMVSTLLIGDHVFVDRVTLAPRAGWMPLIPYHKVKRGDIVVFISPAEPGLYVVKRIIGVPGDRIRLRNGVVILNGQPQTEPYIRRDGTYNVYRDNFPAVAPSDLYGVTPQWQADLPGFIHDGDLAVPEGHFFAMGDNRDVSNDSRFWGFIPQENIIGRPMFIYWSFETPDDQYRKTELSERLGFVVHVVVHFFDETRWRRMFHMVR